MNHSIAKSLFRRGFTLIEMMVAVSILVVIILSIGVVFKGASNSVGISQASLSMLSNVRAIQQQISTDVGSMNRDAFLVIRCGYFTDTQGVVRRCDQVCFVSRGSFPHRTGTTAAGSFTDSTVSSSAFIWWGQLAMERQGANGANGVGTSESATLPLDQIPTPSKVLQNSPTRSASTVEDPNYVLGRSAMLLIPQNAAVVAGGAANMSPNGPTIPAFCSSTIVPTLPGTLGNWPTSAIDYYYPSPSATPNHHQWIGGGGETADITQSRLDAAAISADAIVSSIRSIFAYPITRDPSNANGYYQVSGGLVSAFNRFEADHFCYRRGALSSPYDGQPFGAISSMANGYFRMHPIALQGVSSFAVDWTDGGTFTDRNADMAGGTYGADPTATVDLLTGELLGRPSNSAPPSTPPSEPMLGGTRWYGLCDRSTLPSPANANEIIGYARGRTGPGGGTPLLIAHQYITGSPLGTVKTANNPDFTAASAASAANSDPYVDNGAFGGTVGVAANPSTPHPSGFVTTASVSPASTYTGDLYTAIFSYDTPRANWPVALRFRYHVADPTGRLPSGWDFVQIVRLPTE